MKTLAEPRPAAAPPSPMSTTSNSAERTPAAGSRAWAVLFGSLCLSAGHGLFLALVVTRAGVPTVRDLGGPRLAPVVAWFLVCVPAAPLALLLQRRLLALAPGRLRLLAGLAFLGTAGAFALYLVYLRRAAWGF